MVGPAGYAELEVGTPVTVEWHTAGLLASEPVLLMNVGNAGPVAGGALGNWARNDYQSTYYSYTSFTNAVDLSGVVNPCLLYTSPSPPDRTRYSMPSSACTKTPPPPHPPRIAATSIKK